MLLLLLSSLLLRSASRRNLCLLLLTYPLSIASSQILFSSTLWRWPSCHLFNLSERTSKHISSSKEAALLITEGPFFAISVSKVLHHCKVYTSKLIFSRNYIFLPLNETPSKNFHSDKHPKERLSHCCFSRC